MERLVRIDNWVWNPNTLELHNGTYNVSLEPRVARLFEYLFTHPDELLSHDCIVNAVWDGRVISDEAVRRAVCTLRQALAVDGADHYIRTIHKKGYLASFPEPVALAPDTGAAAPDPEAVPPPVTVEVEHQPPATASRRALWLGAAAVVAVILAVASQTDALREREHNVPQQEIAAPASLAVLPFRNFSDEPDSEFLAEGLAEELLSTLARHPDLRVTARGSAFQLQGQGEDVRAIGERLGVRYVLAGSLRKSANQVRIDARLLDAASGTQLWADGYDRTLDDWFALQQSVALEVAGALESVLPQGDNAAPSPGKTASVDAHLEVLRARQLLSSRSIADAEQAIEHLQRALTLDPDYALAHARLADAMLILAESTTGIKAVRTTVAPLLDKAIALDPGLGEAYALRSRLTDDPAEAERELRRGLELNPSYARGYELLAALQAQSISRLRLALHTIDRAIALDPLAPGNYYTKAELLLSEGEWPEATAQYRRALELNPNFYAALLGLASVSTLEGNLAEAILYTEQALALDPRVANLRDDLAGLYFVLGDSRAAESTSTPPTAFTRIASLWFSGEIGQLADMIYSEPRQPLPGFPAEDVSQMVLAQAIDDGDYTRALNLLETTYQIGNDLPLSTQGWRYYAYANRVQLLAASGDTAAASRLREQIEQRMAAVESHFPHAAKLFNHIRATLLAHAGDSEEACTTLERTFTPAPKPRWRVVVSNSAFDGMRDTPCFRALMARLETHASAERDRLDALRRAGQVPDRGNHSMEATAATTR